MTDLYQPGNRTLQDHFGSRPLADRLDEIIVHDEIRDDDRAFIESCNLFFISTVDEKGRPTVSYKGGETGFVHIVDNKTIAFPGYDGNGMFLTAGNIAANHHVGLLFINFEQPHRLRLHGMASVDVDDPLKKDYVDAEYVVRITIRNLFVNCPRYVHPHTALAPSKYVPQAGQAAPVPDWKKLDVVQDVLPTKK